MKEYVRDFYGRIIGSLERLPNGDVKARDVHGRILGTYAKALNVTKDEHGRIVARGDMTSALIWQANSAMGQAKEPTEQGR